MVEKHLTLKRSDGGPDAAFSMEPEEFGQMVRKIRNTERALGRVTYELNEEQVKSRKNSRSLFVAQDMKKGDVFSESNLKSIRPGIGMHTKYYENVLGQRARCDITKGTPMEWKYAE